MKWRSFLLTLVGVFFVVLVSSGSFAADKIVIQSINFIKESDNLEKVVFVLSSSTQPKIFELKGEKPRLVVDFYGTIFKGETRVELTGGELASAVRLGLHQSPEQKTRAVIDLTPNMVVEHTKELAEDGQAITVVLAGHPPQSEVVTLIKEQEAQKESKQEEKIVPSLEQPAKETVVETNEQIEIPSEAEEVTEQTKIEVAQPEIQQEEPKHLVQTDSKKVVKTTKEVLPGTPQLLEVSFDDTSNRGEMVLFHLNDFYPPAVSAIEKNNPRVLCDFGDMELAEGVKQTIEANGKFVERINTSKLNNTDKVQVVLDLSPNRDYDLQQVFFKNDNLFVLIVNELPGGSVVE